MTTVTKIAVTGPESTGKSLLCEQLAAHYNTVYVPEYAREYVGNLDRPYRQEDILIIAKEQVAREKRAEAFANGILFCDTELLVAKIWEMYKYHTCHPWILQQIERNRYDLFLLCDIDLPWEPDPLREYPHMRKFFFDWFRRELDDHALPYRVISGDKQERRNNAIDVINTFFNIG